MRGCLFVFGLIWMAGVAAFDRLAFSGIYRQARAGQYRAAQATVVDSRVVESEGEDSTIYEPYLQYRFSVGGRFFTRDRFRYGMRQSDLALAQTFVKTHPVGSQMEIWYSPEDPNESVIDKQLNGRDAFLAMFLMPFNAIGMGLLLGPLLLRPTDPDVGLGMGGRLRPEYSHPAVTAISSLGGLSFLAVFVVGLSTSMSPSLETMVLAWVTVAALSAWMVG